MKQKTLFISVVLLLLLTLGAIALYATSGDKSQTVRLTHETPNTGNTVQMSIRPVPPQSRTVPGTNRIQQVNGIQPEQMFEEDPDHRTMSSAPVNPIHSRAGDDLFQLPPPPDRTNAIPQSNFTEDSGIASPLPDFALPPVQERSFGDPPPINSLSSNMTVSPVMLPPEPDYDPNRQIQIASQNPPLGHLPQEMPSSGDFVPLSPGTMPGQYDETSSDVKMIAGRTSSVYRDSTQATANHFQSTQMSDPTMRMGTALPGPVEMDGRQSPIIILEKTMPQEVSLNEQMTVRIHVRNNGGATANHVMVMDRVPQGARLESTSPEASVTEQGDLMWNLDQLEPNTEKTCEMTIVTMEEGQIGSVATATFSVDAGARTRVTKPGLIMEVQTEESHMLGDNVVFEIALTNPGTGITENIILEEYVPEGLFHPKGQKLSSPVGNLNPGETKYLKMSMQAKNSGDMVNRLVAIADGGLSIEVLTPIRLLAPRLDLEIDGPKMRYLERKATYQLQVGNSGSAPARDVKLMAKLPEGVDFISTDSNGVYEPGKHVVHWALEEVPPGQSGEIELVIIPRKLGNCQITFTGDAANELHAETRHDMAVQGIAALCFELIDLADPVEIGQNAIYEIRIANQGTKASQNVRLSVQLSAGMELSDVKAPVSHTNMNGNLDFEPIRELAPKEEKIYTVKAKCLQMGDHRVKVQVISDDLKQPVTKEESTKVYGDE